MTRLAVSDTQAFWQIALAVGAVVLLVVVALMSLLLSFLKDIDANVVAASAVAREVADNTAAIDELSTTASVLGEIRDEAKMHQALLATQ